MGSIPMFRQPANVLVLIHFLAFGTFLGQSAGAADDAESRSWDQVLNTTISPTYEGSEHRTFDFWIGDWDVNWRRQLPDEFHHQPVGSWTRNRVFPILGGKAIMEITWDRDKPETPSQRGMSIRYLDTEKKRWIMAQHWPSSSGAGWAMLDQLIGGEHHGRVSVFSTQRRSAPDGTSRLEHRRYNFSDIRPGVSFRWDGSNTTDFGKTWNTWAISEMHRMSDVPPFEAAGTALPDVVNELLCPDEPHGAFDFMQGAWAGEMVVGDSRQSVTLTAGKALDGCSVVATLESGGTSTLMTFAYSDFFKHWFIFQLDDKPGTRHTYFISPHAGVGSQFEEARNLRIEDEFTEFVTPEKLASPNALTRIVWEKIENDELTWREEIRKFLTADWQEGVSYKLRNID